MCKKEIINFNGPKGLLNIPYNFSKCFIDNTYPITNSSHNNIFLLFTHFRNYFSFFNIDDDSLNVHRVNMYNIIDDVIIANMEMNFIDKCFLVKVSVTNIVTKESQYRYLDINEIFNNFKIVDETINVILKDLKDLKEKINVFPRKQVDMYDLIEIESMKEVEIPYPELKYKYRIVSRNKVFIPQKRVNNGRWILLTKLKYTEKITLYLQAYTSLLDEHIYHNYLKREVYTLEEATRAIFLDMKHNQ